MSPSTVAQAAEERATFRLQVAVTVDIDAPPERVWALLTDAPAFPEWNSTVTSIEGTIAPGEKIVVRVPYSERAFLLKVIESEAPSRMVWADGFAPMFRGERTFTLTPQGAGTRFAMVEVFRGLMLPLIVRSLPDFGPHFEAYARDLKGAAEAA